jgi:hypothetical protein
MIVMLAPAGFAVCAKALVVAGTVHPMFPPSTGGAVHAYKQFHA